LLDEGRSFPRPSADGLPTVESAAIIGRKSEALFQPRQHTRSAASLVHQSGADDSAAVRSGGAVVRTQPVGLTRPFESPSPKRTLILAWRVSFPRHKTIVGASSHYFKRAARASGTIIRLEIRTPRRGWWKIETGDAGPYPKIRHRWGGTSGGCRQPCFAIISNASCARSS